MDSNALKVLMKQNEEAIQTRVAQVTAGGCTYEEYQNVCGQIRGLNLANDNANSLLQRMETSDE